MKTVYRQQETTSSQVVAYTCIVLWTILLVAIYFRNGLMPFLLGLIPFGLALYMGYKSLKEGVRIKEDKLFIRHFMIDIMTITSVQALSYGELVVHYRVHGASCRTNRLRFRGDEGEVFIQQLQQINPNIYIY